MANYILAIDVGSTTTKAILFGPRDGLRFMDWAGAPTTVERPHEDVLVGVRNAINMLEQQTGRKLIENDNIITPSSDKNGVDYFVATSSAGGGLQMMVTGVIKNMTAESANKAALGAGAIVSDVLSVDDGRTDLERIQRIQRLRPDMVLISGGIDGGNKDHVLSMAELVGMAHPESRLGTRFLLPVVYAGNIDARAEVEDFLKEIATVHHVDNLRPVLEEENLEPASDKIQELFLEHVMSHAPGYDKLLKITDGRIMATPSAVGSLLQRIAINNDINVMAVDIGGATTDVFSSMMITHQLHDSTYMSEGTNKKELAAFSNITERKFNRSVDANLGMSYSIGNVLAEAKGANIQRWLPFNISEDDLRDILSNKMIHPTILPQTRKAVLIEHAVAREAINLAITRHRLMASNLSGIHIRRSINEVFNQRIMGNVSQIDMLDLDIIIGSGGVLSHAPERNQALVIMLDSFQPEGITEMYVDSVFMMPHLGVMADIISGDELSVLLKKDCLVPLGTCIAPVGPNARLGGSLAEVTVDFGDGKIETHKITAGTVKSIPLPEGHEATVSVKPAFNYDCGDGKGKIVRALVVGGSGGIILDGRGRKIQLPKTHNERIKLLRQWYDALNAYSNNYLEVE